MEKFEQQKNLEGIRNIEQERIVFLEAIRTTEINDIDTEFDKESVDSLSTALIDSKLLILGEVHGVKENVDIIYTLFKKFGFKTLALEWDTRLQEQAEKFLQTGEFDFGTMQDSPDGRITAGHFALIKKLHDEGMLDKLICFDGSRAIDQNERDAHMAKNIIANLSDSPTLVMAGNLHTKTEPITFDDKSEEYHPMGENIKKQIPDVPSGEIEYLSGQYHNFGTQDFGEKPIGNKSQKARFSKSNDNIYLFELSEAHAGIVPNPTKALLVEGEKQSETSKSN